MIVISIELQMVPSTDTIPVKIGLKFTGNPLTNTKINNNHKIKLYQKV